MPGQGPEGFNLLPDVLVRELSAHLHSPDKRVPTLEPWAGAIGWPVLLQTFGASVLAPTAFTAIAQALSMMITDTWPRVVPMVMHTVSGNLRAKISTAVLVAILAGGTVGMDVIASQLSSEIAHTDRSQPAPVSPNTGFQVASRAL